LFLFWSFCYLAFRCLLQLVLLRPRSEGFKELEIVLPLNTAADTGPLLSESCRGAVLDLDPLPLSRSVRVALAFRDHAFEPTVADGGEERVAVLERRHEPHPWAFDVEFLEQRSPLRVRLGRCREALDGEHVERGGRRHT
jgi:hypothetical protein